MKQIAMTLMAAMLLTQAVAQTDTYWQTDSTATPLTLDIEATTFFRDAEYFLPYTKGYTASGFRLTPQVRYQVDPQVFVAGGVRMTGIAGTEGLAEVRPVLTIGYAPVRWMEIRMGTLEGSLKHGLSEPMYDRERWIYDYQEDGVQIRTKIKDWESDTWVNWEHLLMPWTPDQERFTLGSVWKCPVLTIKEGQEEGMRKIAWVEVPLAFVGSHRGGQFSTLDTCIETLMNESVGVRAGWNRNRRHRIEGEMEWFFFQNQSPKNERYTPFSEGSAIYPRASYEYRGSKGKSGRWPDLGVTVGYYRGHQYIAPRGSYLFQSVSWSDPSVATADRQMVTGDVWIEKTRGEFGVRIGGQFYYDLEQKKLDFAVGLVMDFGKRVNLGRKSYNNY